MIPGKSSSLSHHRYVGSSFNYSFVGLKAFAEWDAYLYRFRRRDSDHEAWRQASDCYSSRTWSPGMCLLLEEASYIGIFVGDSIPYPLHFQRVYVLFLHFRNSVFQLMLHVSNHRIFHLKFNEVSANQFEM